MLNTILTYFKKHPSLILVEKALELERQAAIHGLGGSSSAFLAASLLDMEDTVPRRSILAVYPEEEEAEAFRDDAEAILGTEYVRYFPERDTKPYEHADSHFEVRSRRIETLDLIENGWKGIVIAAAGALHDPTTPPGLIELVSYDVRKGDSVDFEDLTRSLVAKGFKRCNTVSSAGQLAIRGGIIDIFSFGTAVPYRIEFWGDEIVSIRTFSTSSQRSLEEVEGFRIIPPDEFITEAGLNAEDESRIDMIEQQAGIDLQVIKRAFMGKDKPDGGEQYLNTVFGSRASLTAYFSDSDIALIFDPERSVHEMEKRLARAQTIWDIQRHDDPHLPPPEYFFQSPEDVIDGLSSLLVVNNHTLRPPGKTVISFSITPSRQYQGSLDVLKEDIETLHSGGVKCHILCDNSGQAERLDELLDEIAGDYVIDVAHLSGGFTDTVSGMALFTDHEIFGRYRRKVRFSRYKDSVPVPDHRSLMLGEYIVHEEYGIGRFMGLKRDTLGGAETDYLQIQYRENDQLLLPVSQLGRIKKYTSQEGVVPVVTKLGGTSWEKLKERTKKSIQRMAGDLIRLYARRKISGGFAFTADEYMMRSFEESFIYEETPDQLRAWAEIRRDMEDSSPMERLLCGDVGFGKTEIAMRVAILAVLNGKQVAVLVPTTILAEQHDATFRERFADFPVRIDSLSRFKTRKEQKEILERLSHGDIDIIIGTHRILSGDVHIPKLGVLVIDEEQRFGVKHKELLKKYSHDIDVLAMSATPIPRTLNMSLLGARDISYINTPPRDRYSVHTEIVAFEEKSVIEAVMREIDRDGQVYFVHNRVKTIMSMAAYLQRLLPSVSIGVAHGQLPEKKLESVMMDFHKRKFQVLVSSMIIENGLDIPLVNTIIINRADTFGLSQLYQLRGRVGRSNRRAFAYLMIPPKKTLSKIARRRLKTIEEFASLGSGFNIAMRDIEIRGAGNILGTEQSGNISAVGFNLYMDLLRETIAELKGEKIERPPEVEINIRKDAYISDRYIPNPTERVLFYRRLSETLSAEEVKAIEMELLDRFGRPDEPVRNLLDMAYMRHYAAAMGASSISLDNGNASVYIPEGIEITRKKVEDMVKKSPLKLHFSLHKGVKIGFYLTGEQDNKVSEVKKVLQAICI